MNRILKNQVYLGHTILGKTKKSSIKSKKKVNLPDNRPYSLIDWLYYQDWNDPDLIIEILASALQQYPNAEPSGMSFKSIRSECFQALFQKLYQIQYEKPFRIASL